jgi:hypothetical protein
VIACNYDDDNDDDENIFFVLHMVAMVNPFDVVDADFFAPARHEDGDGRLQP